MMLDRHEQPINGLAYELRATLEGLKSAADVRIIEKVAKRKDEGTNHA